MSLKKKILSGSMSALILLSTTVPTFADSHKENIITDMQVIDISNPSDELEISEILTYDELINVIARDKEISIEDAKLIVGDEPITYENGRAVRATYRTLSTSIDVTTSYKPRVSWYCQTTESGGFRAILKIMDTTLIRNYNGISKQFQGTLYTNLEDPNRIFYRVNGDFYNNGTTTFTGGGEIPLKGGATISFSISYATNHYKYTYKESRYSF